MKDPDVFLRPLDPVKLPDETRRLLARFNPRLRPPEPAPAETPPPEEKKP